MRKAWRGGRLCVCRCEVTACVCVCVGELIFSVLVSVRKGRQDVLAAAPLMVSLLTTKAWMFGSQPVGPYTSTMGVMSGIMDGLKNFIKFLTCLVLTSIFCRTCLLALFWRSASSFVAN